MIRKLFFTMSLLFFAVMTFAVPAKRGQWRHIRLTDGTIVNAELRGDENLSFYQSADGRMFLWHDKEVYRQVNPTEVSALHAELSSERHSLRMSKQVNGKSVNKTNTGQKKGLVILTQFKDVKFKPENNQTLYSRILNEENFSHEAGFVGSVHDYFSDASNQTFDLTFDVVGPVTLKNDLAYYGAHGKDIYGREKHDIRASSMVREACLLAADLADFSEYDWDNDGYVDQVVVVFAGLGEANGGDANTIWPHEWTLAVDFGYSLPYIDGKFVKKYACSSELQPASWGYDTDGKPIVTSTKIDGIGTFCHEFTHCLGLPDFYDTEGSNFGMNRWDLMDQGSYNGSGYCPAGYTSYERMFVGWQEPIILSEDTEVKNMKALTEGGESYIIRNDAYSDEFFLLENRQKTKWDYSLPGNGLLILHVDYDSYAWNLNTVNTKADHQRCTIVHADNNAAISNDGLAGDPFPFRINNFLSNTSKPAAKWFHNNSEGNKLFNRVIKNITRNDDNTMSFNFYASATPPDEGNLEEVDHTNAIFYESFNKCNGSGGNDGNWEGSGVASATFKPDNIGWVSSEAKGGKQCARFGLSRQGICLSPQFTLNGSTVLAFRAAPWSADKTDLKIEVVGAGAIDVTDFTMEIGKWKVFKTRITGNGDIKLKFVPGNRFFLDEVVVQSLELGTGIENINTEYNSIQRVYSIDGRYIGTDCRNLPKGLYLINGKRVAVN